jgi:hypothetical protein
LAGEIDNAVMFYNLGRAVVDMDAFNHNGHSFI